MPAIPAYCHRCKIVYDSGYFFEGQEAFLEGNSTECPKCNMLNRIPDGLYNLIDNTISIVNQSEITLVSLRRIKKELQDIQKKNLDTAAVENIISKNIPELNSIIDTLPKTRTELYTFIMIILTVINMAITSFKGDQKQPIEYNKFINNYNYSIESVTNTSDSTLQKPKVLRNDPCYCGSGKKFKDCHWKN